MIYGEHDETWPLKKTIKNLTSHFWIVQVWTLREGANHKPPVNNQQGNHWFYHEKKEVVQMFEQKTILGHSNAFKLCSKQICHSIDENPG